ncbi:chorismate synthase [Bradyrhizobium sp. F1.13.4]
MSFNTFGHMFRVTTFGESHGVAIGCVVDGCPPMIPLVEADIQGDLDRRRPGQSRFTTQRQEPDQVKILSGVMAHPETGVQVTTGTPIGLLIENTDQRSKDYSEIKDKFRPGHADFTYEAKYGLRDYRGGGRSSARETATRVAAGAIARKVLPDVKVRGALVQIGPHKIDRAKWDWDEIANNPFFCPDKDKAAFFETYLDGIRKSGSSIGAVIEVVAEGVPAGLGAPIYAKLDAELASAMMSINAVKGVEIGAGFGAAELTGEENADEMRTGNDGTRFLSNHAGGVPGRYLHGTAGGGAFRGQADLVDPAAAPHRRSQRRRHRDHDQGPPRSLRRHPRRPRRRSRDGLCVGRSFPARSRSGRALALREALVSRH